jgi:hypothetical protein
MTDCKGIRVRAEAKLQAVDRGFQVKYRFRLLKRESCPGCADCREVRHRMLYLGRGVNLHGLEGVKHGSRYKLRLTEDVR